MAREWKWWYQYVPHQSGYDPSGDWKIISDETARDKPTIAGYYTTQKMTKRGMYYFPVVGDAEQVKKVQKIHEVTVWTPHPERAVRLRWGKIHRAMIRLFRHGEIAWYRHTREGILSFALPQEGMLEDREPVVITGEMPARTWLYEHSPDTRDERKADKRWDELQYQTYAYKRTLMGLQDAVKMESRSPTFYEYVPNKLVEKIMEDREIDRKPAEKIAVMEVIGRVRERDKQNIADARKVTADARGMCGTWTSDDGGAWRRYIKPTVVVGRTHDEIVAQIREDKKREGIS